MQSLPFLVEAIPLWGHRLWQVFLWVVFTAGAAYLFARRLRLEKKSAFLSVAFWAYLFLFQGPVYYHLAIPLIIILGWFEPRKFWRGLILVVLASLWAGISRVNWFPVPGMLAIALYLLEEKQADVPLWRYLWPPAVWAIAGLGTAFASQWLYVIWSGNDAEKFASSLSSDLLWYRLWPNTTYPLGLVLNTFLVSLPLLWVICSPLWKGRRNWRPIRVIGLLAMLLVLLAGGLVVSVKIGGGSNLHNIDAYLALLLVIGGYFYFDRFVPDSNVPQKMGYSWFWTLALVAIPVFFVLAAGAPSKLPQPEVVSASLDAVHKHIQYAGRDGGDILLISQRHLIYFDDEIDVALIPKYEKVFFMEMVMSRNPAYLNAFYDDLQAQRYAAIVGDQALDYYKDRAEAWSEEHNIWVQLVSRPLLCYYQPRLTLRQVHVQIFYPRPNVENCAAIDEARQIVEQELP